MSLCCGFLWCDLVWALRPICCTGGFTFYLQIEKLKRRDNAVTFDPALPLHPLLMNKQIQTGNRSKVTPMPCDSRLPEHPLLLQYRKLQDKSHAHHVTPHQQPSRLLPLPSSQPAHDQTSPPLTSSSNSDHRPYPLIEGVGKHDDPYGVSVRRGGLSALVAKCFGKPLDKSQQLSDWEKRPLYPEQVTYAGISQWWLKLAIYLLMISLLTICYLSYNTIHILPVTYNIPRPCTHAHIHTLHMCTYTHTLLTTHTPPTHTPHVQLLTLTVY